MYQNLELFETPSPKGNNQPIFDETIFDGYAKKERIKNTDNVMHYFESRLRAAGYQSIAGVDEAGRGPLAGPVVAAIVMLPADYHVCGLYDSKAVSEKVRESVFAALTSDPGVKWAVGIIDNGEIDRLNILQATYRAVHQAYSSLERRPDFILNDAMIVPTIKTSQKKIIKGDAKSASIAAASIIAKVTRDRIMGEYDQKYPQYGFSSHKGYGTASHIENIRRHGYCPIHRLSFKIDID
jgi:ribonuclease HII